MSAGKAESHPGRRVSSHSCLAKGLVESRLFGLVGLARFYASGNVSILGAMTGSRFVGIAPWLGGKRGKAYIVL